MSKWILILVLLLVASRSNGGAIEEDEKECTEQLTSLASCIPFVSGSAGKPTAECCMATEKVRITEPKCLCVLVVESIDPSMALPINTTLALQMPAACHSNGKVSDCPSLLKLSPDSPNAKIFKDASTKASTTNPATSSSDTSSSSSGSGSSGGGTESTTGTKSNSGQLVGLVGGGVVSLMASILMLFM